MSEQQDRPGPDAKGPSGITIRQKLMLVVGGLMALATIGALYLQRGIAEGRESIESQQQALHRLQGASQAASSFAHLQQQLADYAITWQSEALDQALEVQAELLAEVERQTEYDPEAMTGPAERITEYADKLTESVDYFMDEERYDGTVLVEEGRVLAGGIEGAFVELCQGEAEAVGEKVIGHSRRLERRGTLMALTFLILGVVLVHFLPRMVTSPIRALLAQMKAVSGGSRDLTQRVHLQRADEMGAVATDFNSFVETIHGVVVDVLEGADQIEDTSQQVAGSAVDAAQVASGQAGTLSELAQVVSELHDLTLKNRDSTGQADALSAPASKDADSVSEQVGRCRKPWVAFWSPAR